MVLLLGLCGEMSERMIDAVKEFLEKMWYARSRNYIVRVIRVCIFLFCVLSIFFPLTGATNTKVWRERNFKSPVTSRSTSNQLWRQDQDQDRYRVGPHFWSCHCEHITHIPQTATYPTIEGACTHYLSSSGEPRHPYSPVIKESRLDKIALFCFNWIWQEIRSTCQYKKSILICSLLVPQICPNPRWPPSPVPNAKN